MYKIAQDIQDEERGEYIFLSFFLLSVLSVLSVVKNLSQNIASNVLAYFLPQRSQRAQREERNMYSPLSSSCISCPNLVHPVNSSLLVFLVIFSWPFWGRERGLGRFSFRGSRSRWGSSRRYVHLFG